MLAHLNVDRKAINLDESLQVAWATYRAANHDCLPVRKREIQSNHVSPVRTVGGCRQRHSNTALGGEQRRIHIRNWLGDQLPENTLECSEFENANVLFGNLPKNFNLKGLEWRSSK